MRKLLFLIGLLTLGALPAQAAVVTLFDDTFDADSPDPLVQTYVTTTTLTKWNVLQGNVDALSTDWGCTGCIDLDGTSSPAAAVLETKDLLHFVSGVTYTFQLFFAPGSAEEGVTFCVVNCVPLSPSPGGSSQTYTFIDAPFGDLDSTMQIKMAGPPDNIGPYLDRVLVTYDDGLPTVPVPASAPLLLAGVAGLGFLRRRAR